MGSEYLDFTLVPDNTFQYLSLATSAQGPGGSQLSSSATYNIVIKDTSFDTGSASSSVQGGADSNSAVNYHVFELTADWVGGVRPSPGWNMLNGLPSPPPSVRGQSYSGSIVIQTLPTNTVLEAKVLVTVKLRSQARPDFVVERNETFTAKIYPSPALQMQILYGSPVGAPLNAKPNTWVTIPLLVQNGDLYVQKVNVNLIVGPGDNIDPANIAIVGLNPVVLEPLESRIVNVSVLTPKATTWYRATPMAYTAVVTSATSESVSFRADSVLVLDGFYFARPILILIPILLLLLVILILVLLVAKRYYDEKILGKPIPPWRVPEEARHLEVLRKENPREFYVVRYFIMVEEYESALNWFHGYKKRSKKQLKRQARSDRLADKALVLKSPVLDKFDARAVRIKKQMHRKQERERLKLEAELEKLQTKLDRHYEEDYEKDHEKWEKKVQKLKAKANKPWFKARKKWEKDVEKILAKWEKPFAKEKAKNEKAIEKAKDKYEKQVKKKDKDAWRAWMEDVATTEKENRIRAKEDREPLPEPILVSSVVGDPKLPAPFKAPPKPKLPPEPKEPAVEGLPPEPEHDKPVLEKSHYARKTRRERKKTDRKVARLEKKMNKMLARNERDRVRAIAKAGRNREKLLRKSQRVIQPTLMERLFKRTPEDRERRAHKKLLKALAKERMKAVEEAEKSRLEVLRVEAQRREAELLSRLLKSQAEVRKSSGSSSMRVENQPEFVQLREESEARLAKEKAVSQRKVQQERAAIERQLREQLTEELVKERTAKQQAAAVPKPAPKQERKAEPEEAAPKKKTKSSKS